MSMPMVLAIVALHGEKVSEKVAHCEEYIHETQHI